MDKNRAFAIVLFSLILASPRFSYGDDSERIRELEQKVEELTRIVNELSARQQTPPAVREEPAVPEEINEDEKPVAPQLTLRGFGHAQYDYAQTNFSDGTAGDTNHFANGELDLFITSRVAEKISFLNETVFEFKEGASHNPDVERLLLKYEANNKFNVSIGRGHTALGYWNQTFHHGTWLQTTTGRPAIYRLEDHGGILPMHFVGLEFSGTLDMPGGTLNYVSNLANGRGEIADEVQMSNDDNDSKMAGGMLTYKVAAVEGLGFGANYIRDIIPARAGTANRGGEIDENLSGAHIFYVKDPFEVILEGQLINHFNHATGLRDETVGAYGQLACKMGKYKPYLRFDWLNISDRDPFYEGLVEDETSHTLGLRYDLTTFNALKLEYRHSDKDNSRSNEATLQSAFAF
ncbi:MAG: hypothetical protein HZA29_04945 [Candidatus Omnitrophica bacterium]|nr:hypothetical protein [Candidatus Omnitrophota bacterium]